MRYGRGKVWIAAAALALALACPAFAAEQSVEQTAKEAVGQAAQAVGQAAQDAAAAAEQMANQAAADAEKGAAAAKEAMDKAAQAVGEMAQNAAAKAEEVAGQMKAAAGEMADKAAVAAGQAMEAARSAAISMSEGVADLAAQLADKMKPVPETVTLALDGPADLNNGGTIRVKGQAPAGKPVFLEVWAADHKVRASRFDSAPDPETGKRPYIFYLTEALPAYYKIFAPNDLKGVIDEERKKGNKWSMSAIIKNLGADAAFNVPAQAPVKSFQSSFAASIIGSRGEQLSDAPNRKSAMQLTKARFRGLGRVIGTGVQVNPDGSFTAEIPIAKGSAPGAYKVVASAGEAKSDPVGFSNTVRLPNVYLPNAGTTMNLIYPFLLAFAVTLFGVLMGAGGGFILNPLLLTLFPTLTHTIVAGTVTPTVLFSQGSGIYNYSKIKFISWKLGIGIGLAMLAGGFIGPKLTEMITLNQFTFAFGWILLVLAALMFWQTTPGYIEKNKKEKAILEEFKKRAVAAAKDKSVIADK